MHARPAFAFKQTSSAFKYHLHPFLLNLSRNLAQVSCCSPRQRRALGPCPRRAQRGRLEGRAYKTPAARSRKHSCRAKLSSNLYIILSVKFPKNVHLLPPQRTPLAHEMAPPAPMTCSPKWVAPEGWVTNPGQVVKATFPRRSHAENVTAPQLDLSPPNVFAVIQKLGVVAAAAPSTRYVQRHSSSTGRRGRQRKVIKPGKPRSSAKSHK